MVNNLNRKTFSPNISPFFTCHLSLSPFPFPFSLSLASISCHHFHLSRRPRSGRRGGGPHSLDHLPSLPPPPTTHGHHLLLLLQHHRVAVATAAAAAMSFRGSTASYSLPPPIIPFQLLEINLISAQDLAPVTRGMKTYAVAWVHPDRKLSTRLDATGHTDPTWNDKFVFRVNESFLSSDTSAVMIEIYAVRCFRDVCIGAVRVLVGNLIPSSARNQQHSGTRFVALQVRRPSGRPQGILNIGVALLDGSMRSMPLYTHLNSSAVGYRDLMGEQPNSPNHHHLQPHNQTIFRRAKSERRSEAADSDFIYIGVGGGGKSGAGSLFGGSEMGDPPLATVTTTGSVWSVSDVGPAPSVVAAALREDQLFAVAEVVGSNDPNEARESDCWDADTRVEGLKSKLERWRTELPPIYDSSVDKGKSKGRHGRRRTDGGSGGGLLSCFGDSYGFECSISCGLKPKGKRHGGKGKKGPPSTYVDDSQSYLS